MEKNGKFSSMKNTKHIRVRYYFIKDWVESGEVVIKNCPTTEILGDICTNLLQGALIRKYRAEIMNIPDDINMDKMGMDRTGIKKGVTSKLHVKTGPE